MIAAIDQVRERERKKIKHLQIRELSLSFLTTPPYKSRLTETENGFMEPKKKSFWR